MARETGGDEGQRILTKHPEGKQGVNIAKEKYEAMRAAILRNLGGRGEVTLQEVREEVEGDLEDAFEGSVSWYFTTVKLDLEARGILQRVPGKRPQRIKLKEEGTDGQRA